MDLGLVYTVYSYGEEIHQNFLMLSVAGVLAWVMASPIQDKLPHRKGLLLFLVLATIPCALASFLTVPYYCFDSSISCF